ncbi:hypothetical protein AB4212_71585, partial [Streptomyces sp. 2MCAF27]
MVGDVPLHQFDDLVDDRVDIDRQPLGIRLAGQAAQPLDDMVGAPAFPDDAFGAGPGLRQVGHRAVEPAQAGLAVGD